jgi:hypothetical protein
MWRCEFCGVKNGIRPDVLTVHHLDGNKWKLLPWNLAALCQRCPREAQWTIDFYQANLTGVYPGWLRTHVEAYNHWAQNKGRPQLALAPMLSFKRSSALRQLGSRQPWGSYQCM